MADGVAEPWLRRNSLERLCAMRRQLFLLQKLVDFRLFAVTPWILLIDTDVLFFSYPGELLGFPPDAPDRFLRDDHPPLR